MFWCRIARNISDLFTRVRTRLLNWTDAETLESPEGADLYNSPAQELFEEWATIMPTDVVLSLDLHDLFGAQRITDGSYRVLKAPTTPIDADLYRRTKSYRLELLNRPLVPASSRVFVGEDGVPLTLDTIDGTRKRGGYVDSSAAQ